MRSCAIGHVQLGSEHPLVLIAGPCVIESEEHALRMAEALAAIASRLNMPYVFKSSYDKANRSSLSSFRGLGIDCGLAILRKISNLGIPTLTDVHETAQVPAVAEVVDCLQIPAFLGRQTDLLLAAGKSGRCINLKKPQFMSPTEMQHAIEKVRSTGNDAVFVTERGTSFGYNNLVVDFRALQVLRQFGQPVVFDASHSVQLPGGVGGSSGGDSEFIPGLARAAAGVGIDGLFVEVHDDPAHALSDGKNALPLPCLETVLLQVLEVDAAMRRTCR
jgi:2-dehydro-3-deoxyphosphooctonate aldolase (KDO 8-P synthase)